MFNYKVFLMIGYMIFIGLLKGCTMQSTLIEQVRFGVSQVYADKPIVGQLALAQAILESNLLQNPSTLAVKYHNLFGIKARGTLGTVKLKTTEIIRGRPVTVYAPFGYNRTMTDSIRQHRQVLELPRYIKVLNASSFEEAAKEIYIAGYATDPKYTAKLIKIYTDYIK